MIVLGIETATPLLGVALVDGRGVAGEYSLRRDRAHAERLLELIDAVLGQCGVDRAAVGGVAVSAGPGSFTGLRIGMAAAKAWAFGTGAAFCAVPTLDALAHQAGAVGVAAGVAGAAGKAGAPAGAGTLCPVINARRGQVYYALYPAGASAAGAPPATALSAATPAAAAVPAATTPAGLLEVLAAVPGTLYLCGDGLWEGGFADDARRALGERLVRLDATFDLPRAGAVAALGRRRLLAGRADDPYAAAPVYVAIPAAQPFSRPAPGVEAARAAAPGARRRGGGGGARG